MQLLVIAILSLCTGLLLFILKECMKENKELQGLVIASRKNLRNAEEQGQSNKDFKNKAISIMNGEGTIVDKYDKIKELVSDYQSIN